MIWIIIALVAVVLVIATSGQTTTPATVDAEALGTGGHIEAIEYFWRPG